MGDLHLRLTTSLDAIESWKQKQTENIEILDLTTGYWLLAWCIVYCVVLSVKC